MELIRGKNAFILVYDVQTRLDANFKFITTDFSWQRRDKRCTQTVVQLLCNKELILLINVRKSEEQTITVILQLNILTTFLNHL
jgi:hypothetical protein